MLNKRKYYNGKIEFIIKSFIYFSISTFVFQHTKLIKLITFMR